MSHMRDRFTLPPVGTIYWSRAHERAWKVVKRTEKTLWLQELEVTHSRTAPPTISRSTVIGDVIMRRIDNTGSICPDENTTLHPYRDIAAFWLLLPNMLCYPPPIQGHRLQARVERKPQMATATPQAMPVGTILQMCDLSFYEVVRATAKTVWVQELRTKTEPLLVFGPLLPSEGPT